MLVLRQPGDSAHVTDPIIRRLIETRFAEIAEQFEGDCSIPILVAQPNDREADISQQLGFSIFENRFNGSRLGDAGFTPSFEILERHECCVELVFILSDEGSGVLVFVPNDVALDPRFPLLCELYAIPTEET